MKNCLVVSISVIVLSVNSLFASNEFSTCNSYPGNENQVQVQSGSEINNQSKKPFEIKVTSALDEAKGIDLVLAENSKQVKEFVRLTIKGKLEKRYVLSLYDKSGRLLESINIQGNETRIPMQNHDAGEYILKVFTYTSAPSIKELKVFRIIKH